LVPPRTSGPAGRCPRRFGAGHHRRSSTPSGPGRPGAAYPGGGAGPGAAGRPDRARSRSRSRHGHHRRPRRLAARGCGAPVSGRIDVVTIFPDYLSPLDLSLVGRARRDGLVHISVHDLRSWTDDAHRTGDDARFGGGAGMVMMPGVWGCALDEVLQQGDHDSRALVLPSPAGEPFDQAGAEELALKMAAGAQLVLACGRYEGIDARVVE